MNRPSHLVHWSVEMALNFQDYQILCEWVKYFLSAVLGAGDDRLEIVYCK